MLMVLPEVNRETCFAIHGGTAINLFIQDMPRLSVDIDLTYLPFDSRTHALDNISEALLRIKGRIHKVQPAARVVLLPETSKLLVNYRGVQTKLEVNQTNRGVLYPPVEMILCEKAQKEFEVFCSIQVVEEGQLYGGKICAALDRQHPRDLFDIQHFLEESKFSYRHKEGLLLALLGSNRPIEELLFPHLLNQQKVFSNHFLGMTNHNFDYVDFELSRKRLLDLIHQELSGKDKEFIMSVLELQPNWDAYNFEKFPSVQWKLQNLEKLRSHDAVKYSAYIERAKLRLGLL